jgi:pyroglutamyl-peptidase
LIESLRQELPTALQPFRDRLRLEVIEWEQGAADVESRSLRQRLDELMQQHRPELCLFTGQARGDSAIRIERVGLNIFGDRPIEGRGPVGYWSTLPGLEGLPQRLRAAGIPASHSYSAGTYLCNHLLYSSLHRVGGDPQRLKAGFIHIPLTPEQTTHAPVGVPHMPTALVVKAMSQILLHTVEHIEQPARAQLHV